ncbi:MAG: prepilin-type N-terminal cleavage/methylation domain-containing protein, partial [Phycisphaerales bacterium]|nr:prepilin-type N-terminal cleavage/methylation domain-containing protein [Phycisphaerales bacterium]
MSSSPFIPTRNRHGFTLVEVLVVISIIVVLAGILLVALGSATESAKRAKTTTSLASFRAACDSFALDHNFYPGVVPASSLDGLRLTSTQNALLHLMGGYRVYNAQSPAGDQAQYIS